MSYLNNYEIKNKLDTIDGLKSLIHQMEKTIKLYKNEINNLENELINKCQHMKEIDRLNFGERTSFYCSVCKQDL
jgi:hypothetical protein